MEFKITIFVKKLLWLNQSNIHCENCFFESKKHFFESKKHFFDIRSKKVFLWIKESFVNSKKISLIQRNRFVYIKENFFGSTKFSSIQRCFFFNSILKKSFFDSKKLFSGCIFKSNKLFRQRICSNIWILYFLQFKILIFNIKNFLFMW